MLNAGYTAVGIGRVDVAGSPYSWYWTTDFGGMPDGYTASGTPTTTPSQPQATPTRTPTRTPVGTQSPVECADMNADGRVRVYDITLIVRSYGTIDPLADLNNDGVVTSTDVSAAVRAFGSSCTR